MPLTTHLKVILLYLFQEIAVFICSVSQQVIAFRACTCILYHINSAFFKVSTAFIGNSFSPYLTFMFDPTINGLSFLSELPHDKTNKMTLRPAKTWISLGIRAVWWESSLSAWRKLGSLATHCTHSEDSAQTDLSLRWAHMPFCCFCLYLHIQTYGQTNPWSTLSVCRYYIDIIKVYPIGLDKNLYSPTQRAFKWRKINKDFHFFKKLLLTLPERNRNNLECLISFLDSKGTDKNFDHYRQNGP